MQPYGRVPTVNKMKIKLLVSAIAFLLGQDTFAQINLPTIKAHAPKVSIKDGWEGKTRYWNHLVKSKSPLVYHLAKNSIERQVTFYTDIDSISFTVKTGTDYRFNVLLNQSDTCAVVLTTKNQPYSSINGTNNAIDTLPFAFNKNKQIIIKGSINNSPQMDFCFDLGARMVCLIGKDFDKPNKLVIDGMMEDESVTGLSTEKTSSNNTLQLGNLSIDNIPICYIDEAGFLENGGGLVGFNVFQNKILEIDFDNQLLLIYDKLPEKIKTYGQIAFKQTTGGLYIPLTTNNGKKKSTGWYFFDTGADFNLTFDSKFANKESLYNTMKVIGKQGIASSENKIIDAAVLEVPELQIAGFKLENIPTLLANESHAEADFEDGVIGIGLQSRFNFIIDYPNSKMYLKPSRYFTDSFKKKDSKTGLMIGLVTVFAILLIGLVIYKKKNSKRKGMA
jgi:hypothetical protein